MQRLVLYLVMPPILFLFVAELTVLGGAGLAYPGEYPDPFAPYEAMMPGQWAVASRELPCDFLIIYRFGDTVACELWPLEGPFVSVASNTYRGNFVRSSFSADDLYVGDVIRHWGRPDLVVKFNHRSFYVLWADQGLIGIIDPVGPVGRFSHLLPIENFTIGLGQPYLHP